MSAQGSTPLSPTIRTVGTQRLSVRQTRTQSLRPEDRVLYRQRKCTVLCVDRVPGGKFMVQMSAPDGSVCTVTKPPGFVWGVLDN